MQLHHISIRTRDIFAALAFYELLGFAVEERFTAGITLACWLSGCGGRLELIQIPEPHPAPDSWFDEHYTGYYHLSFQVEDLAVLLAKLQAAGVRLLLDPREQVIGATTYRIAFVADRDGLPIELIEVIAVSQPTP